MKDGPLEVAAPAPLNEGPLQCASWRQGDVFYIEKLWIADRSGQPDQHACPLGAAVVSQSCDASQPERSFIQLAPVVRLAGNQAQEARNGKRPRYAHLADAGDDLFADLEIISTVHKAYLAHISRDAGVEEDDAVRRFAGAVARRFGRYAFPDDVVQCLQPLRDAIASKAAKPDSPLGRTLLSVEALRIEVAKAWTQEPYEITLIVIVAPGVLPTIDAPTGETDYEHLPDAPADLEEEMRDRAGILQPSLICQRLGASDLDPGARYWLWQFLGQAWAEQCEGRARKLGLLQIVSSVRHELVTADEFPLSRVNRSEALDLDYLSEPLPRDSLEASERTHSD